MDEPGTPPPYQVSALRIHRKCCQLQGSALLCAGFSQAGPELPAGLQEQTLEDSPAPCTPHLEALAGHASQFQARSVSRACAYTSCYMVHLAQRKCRI